MIVIATPEVWIEPLALAPLRGFAPEIGYFGRWGDGEVVDSFGSIEPEFPKTAVVKTYPILEGCDSC